jgi:hypothetical protein
MIRSELLRDAGVLVVEPTAPLAADDFRKLSLTVDPDVREKGKLTGLLILAPSFPGWESFGALIEHIKFVVNHHRKIDRVAVATDNQILSLVPKIVEHFAHPQFKVFGGGERTRALA